MVAKGSPFVLRVPDSLTVPKTVVSQFPDLLPWLDDLGVDVIKATSGFQAGVRDLRTWEDEFRNKLSWYPADDLKRLPALAESMSYDLTERELFKRPHVER